MRLIHKDFGFTFDFKENTKSLLVVENPTEFCGMVQELISDDLTEEQRFVLSENNVPIKRKDHLLCVVNPLSITLNERRLLGKLGEILKKEILSSELLLENNQIIVSLEKYALHIIQNMDWELTYTDKIDVQSLLKFVGIQFEDHQNSLIEKMVDYIRVTHDMLGVDCFVFVHLLSYLTEYEMEKLYEYAWYYKINLLLLESRQPESIESFKEIVIIDKDACEILLNM